MKRMNEARYQWVSNSIRRRKYGAFFVNALDKAITLLVFVLYPLFIIYLILFSRNLLWKSILIPAIGFLAVSMFRYIVSEKRPYEIMNFEPILHKNSTGKSFPSRHVFSIFMISMTYFLIDCGLGILVLVLGFILGFLRVVGGVHYIKDVVVAALLAVGWGFLGYFVLI